MKKQNILKILTPPMGEDGCWWYRVKNFANIANQEKLASVQEIKANDNDALVEAAFDACDALLYRFASESIVKVVKVFKKKYPHKPVILETDDDLFNISPLSNAYANLGTKEVFLPDGTPLWQQGKAKFDLYENRKRLIDYEFCLSQSDLVLTTTIRLANKLKEYNEAVAVIPNAINFDFWPALDIKKETGVVNMVYAGGASHFEDLMMVKEALLKLMETYPQLHLHFVGQLFGGVKKGLPKSRVHFWPWVKADGHGYRMACINADIAIAPLEDKEFNRNKSSVKFYEYSALKIPSVVSNVPPYADEVQEKVNGLLFKTPDEFMRKVSALIDDPLLRRELGENAYAWVKEHRDVRVIAKDWVEVIKKTVEVMKK